MAAETGIAWGCCSSPSFLLQTCAKACWGRRWGEEALAGFQLRLGSLAVPQYLCLTRGPGLGTPELGRGLTWKMSVGNEHLCCEGSTRAPVSEGMG